MRSPIARAIAVISLCCSTTFAGDITGSVSAEGKKVEDHAKGDAKYDSRKFKFVERVDYEAMRDFVVYIEGPIPTPTKAPGKPVQVVTSREISQRGARFSPHVLPIFVGTTVEWPNNDDIYHNVFSYSEARDFDLGLYKSGVVKQVTFDKPGKVDVFCSIHKSMSCVVLVLKNPFFSATDADGKYAIKNVPAGAYRLKAWHERMPPQIVTVTVPADGEVKVDFKLGINGLPQY